jgi:PAS domain S-box-containing protein
MFSIDAELAAKGLPAEAYFQPIFEEDRAAVAAALEQAIQTRSRYDIEYRVRQRDGKLKWLQGRGRVESDDSGNALNFHGAIVDIAERKQAEEARQASETRYRALFDNAPDGIVIADMEGHYLDANPTMCGMLGYSHEEMIARSVADVVVPTEISQIVPAFDEVDGGAVHHREWLFRRKDGSVFAAEVTATQVPNGLVMGMVRDVTERKRAQERIAEQAEFLDKAQDAILVRDLEGNIRFWNRGAERMYGWTFEEVMGRNIAGVLYADPHVFEEFNRTTIEKGEWHGELRNLTKDRGEITIEARWTLIRDDAGQPEAVLAINTDITDKKKIEAQFLRAQRMESIGTLAGGIAHDLNNVLGPILMSLDILKMKFPDRSSQELISIINTSAQRGADMVRQVLSFARGVEGRRMEVQLKHLIQDMEKIANDTFLKNIQVRTIIPPDLWTVLGDPTQLHQVLLNLCVNARDAMPDGGTLTLSAENLVLDAHYAGMNLDAKPGPYVVLQVEDSGTGMPAEVIEKIFDPFFTTKEVGKGTGLGLSTSMAIVKSHAGFVRVYSEPGRGTKFKVYLPAETESSPTVEAERAATMPRGNGQVILVVDDEIAVRQITEQTLQAYGYRVILACDGAEAVAIFARQGTEIAAVLTDMMMPIMDGPATIQALQRMSPKTPIIAASGLMANGHVARAANLGIKHFLPKPYTAETLLKILQEVLRDPPA